MDTGSTSTAQSGSEENHGDHEGEDDIGKPVS